MQGASATTAVAHYLSRGSADIDSMEMSMRSDTTQQPSIASPRPTGHGPVCTDKNHAVIFSRAKPGEHQNSLLQTKQETTSTAFCKRGCESLKWNPEQGRGKGPLAPATSPLWELQCHFHVCATDFSAATATSTSLQGICLAYSQTLDASKPDHPTSSADPSGTQRTAAAQRRVDFLRCC